MSLRKETGVFCGSMTPVASRIGNRPRRESGASSQRSGAHLTYLVEKYGRVPVYRDGLSLRGSRYGIWRA